MSINVNLYSNANSSSKSITFDFVGDILAADDSPANNTSTAYYFKITASGIQDNNVAFPVKIVRSMTDLALNKTKQRIVDTSAPYSTIKSMVVDYCYDYINGHDAGLYSSGCTSQRPMKF